MTTQGLQPGDIVFFQWKGWTDDSVRDPDFENFSHVAGYAQDLAYDAKARRYWHHCEVMVSDTEAVGFAQIPSETGMVWKPVIDRHALTVRTDQTIAILRPDQRTVDGIVRRALATTGSHYSVGALLAFGFATQRRLFVGEARQDLTRFVAGAYHFARRPNQDIPGTFVPVDRQHTCASAVLAAVGARAIPEPAERVTPVSADRDFTRSVGPTFERLRDRVSGSGSALGVDVADEVLSKELIEKGFGIDVGMHVPGLLETTKEYLDLINAVATGLVKGRPGPRLPDVGADYPLDEDDTPAWLVSPAMLWDRLVADGYEIIDV